MDRSNPRVLVVGGGIMGRGIAAGWLAQDHDVVLLVRDPAHSEDIHRQVLALIDLPTDAHAASLSVRAIDGFADWDGLSLVIESVTEDLPLKQRLFAWLDAHVPPEVPVGSNSSSHPISRIAQGLATRSRMLGMHYFMPAHRVPLVEVVLGADSSPALADWVCAMFAAAGKKPVLVRRDIPGFIANRIQHAMLREVLALIDSGIASPEDIDMAVRYSFGFRLAACGPVLQKEMSGWDTTLSAAREIYPDLSSSPVPAACLERLVAKGRTGMKSGQGFIAWTPEAAQARRAAYDERLAAALRLLD